MLWTILAILIALWVVGLVTHVVGGLIHILLVIALAIFIYRLVTGRKTT